MKRTLCYFIIRRYEKGILLSAKYAFAVLLAAFVQFSAYANPLKGHSLKNDDKGLLLNIPSSKSPGNKAELSDIKVNGKVTDDKGETLIGATVAVKNGKSLAFTDANGNFSVTVPE